MNGYLVNCQYLMKRTGDYDRRNLVADNFGVEFDQSCPTTKGSISSELLIEKATLKCIFHSYDDDPKERRVEFRESQNDKYARLYEAIPSALLLYRLICTFGFVNLEINGNESYKVVWHYVLNHKKTNSKIVFCDFKGGSSIHTNFHTYKEMPEILRTDLISLIEYLLSDECAHPYDSTVAGSVA